MRRINKGILYFAVIFGCAAIYLFPKLCAFYLFIFLTLVIILFIAKAKKMDPKNKRFLIVMILLIFISRFILSFLIMEMRKGELAQDEGLYSKKALMKSFEMKDINNTEEIFEMYFKDYDMIQKGYGFNSYTYVLSWFYYLFGYQIQAARFINIFFNIIVFLLIFYITKEVSGSGVAKISSSVFSFFPSIMLWSVMISVDMLVLLGITGYIFSLIKLIKKFGFKWIFVIGISLFIVASIRQYLVFALILVTAISIMFKVFLNLNKKGKLIALLLLLFYGAMLLGIALTPFSKIIIEEEMGVLIQRQRNFARSDDSGYHVYPEHCYEDFKCSFVDFLRGYTKGMGYVLFSPFPWRIESKLQLMAYFQVIFWYFMLPFILYGFYIGFRSNWIATFLIFSYSFLVFSVFALVEGNVGALFRHKDMVMPFLLIYFAVGIQKVTQNLKVNPVRKPCYKWRDFLTG